MNSLNWQAYDELEQAFRDLQKNTEVRCIILTGAGTRAFCAGDDIKQIMSNIDSEDGGGGRLRVIRPGTTPAAKAVLDCDRPIIAAINGSAIGWGMDLALMADFLIAADNAKFGELFVKRGLVADVGGLVRLPKLVGPQKAAELLFTGDIISAQEAKDIGMLLDAVPSDELMSTARALASRISCNPPLAVRHLKEGLRRSYWNDYDDVGNWVAQALNVLFRTEDHKESVASFNEKRDPTFYGR